MTERMTAGSLGEKIGEGATADVHAWAPGQVLKLFKPHIGLELARYEGRLTRAVFARGYPGPEMLGETTLGERYGIVLSRLHGQNLLRLWQADAVTSQEVAATIIGLAMSVHAAPPPRALSLQDWMELLLRDGEPLPPLLAGGVSILVDRLPPADRLCHCDLHPGNVIMTAEGPRLLDWTVAKLGTAALDLATCHYQLIELAPAELGEPARLAALDAALQAEYARRAGISLAALAAAMRPYLPIVCAYNLLMGGTRPGMRPRRLRRLRAYLRAEDLI